MSKIKNISLGFMAALLLVVGCDDDFVSTEPLGEVQAEATWRDQALSEAFINEIYNGLGQGGFQEQMLASLTDEAIFTHPGRDINTVTEARSNSASPGWISNTRNWPDMYTRIRATNIALENLAEPKFENTVLADRLKGEATFMRAYFYHQLLRNYGGVPIVDRAYTLGEPDYKVARNTFEECVNFIVKDCEAAAALLKGKATVKGRASEAAALALKSRVLLYAASDLHEASKSTVMSSFSKPELIGYVSGNQMERWQKAKDAAEAVLNYFGKAGGYKTTLTAPATPDEAKANYKSIAMGGGSGAPGIDKTAESEILFGRYYLNAREEEAGRHGRANGPNGYRNWAGNNPTQNLVDDYEMMDGTEFSWTDPAKASAPYQNRDPRFYATILYDGAPWKPRIKEMQAVDPVNQIQVGQYEVVNAAGQKVTHFGVDSRKAAIESWNGTHTGYYVHKFIDPNPAIVDQFTGQEIPWPFFRYTEAMLNYAEACIALGQDAEALTWINRVRFRSGMPAITETGDALRERYRNERRVELAFEEHRYYDARRWMIAPQTLGQKAGIINITGTLKPGKSVSVYKYDPESYNYVYRPTTIDPGHENRQWQDKMYFLPIHRDEMNRNDKLVQNPGY